MEKKHSRSSEREPARAVGKLRGVRLRRKRRITAGHLHHRAPVWSSGGRLLASALGDGHETTWLVTDRKGRVARVLEGPAEGSASFAPDGALAYGRQVGATTEIWVLPSSSAGPRRLLGGDGRLYRDPAYSPDGRFLCYAADDGPGPTLDHGPGHGPSGSLRLWLLDLARDEHSLLIGGGVSRTSTREAVRFSHPAWSPAGDCIYFEAEYGDDTALYVLELSTRQAVRLTDAGYRRPAPLGGGLLLCERARPGGTTEIVLIEHRAIPTGEPGDERRPGKLRATVLLPRPSCAREPAVAISRKGTVLIAWSMPCIADLGEPQRCDVHVAELAGLPEKLRLRGGSHLPQHDTPGAGDTAASDEEEVREPAVSGESSDSTAAAPAPAKPRRHSDERPLTIGAALFESSEDDGEASRSS